MLDRTTFDRIVAALTATRSDGVRMSSLAVAGPAGTFRHDFTGHEDPRIAIRSITKVVVSLAVGAAIAAGERVRDRPLSLDLEIWPLVADLAGRSTVDVAHLRAVRLRHLLTSTTGHDEGFLFRDDLRGRDLDALLPHVLAHELVHPPGAHFAYSNAGWFLLSVLVAEELGTSLSEWVATHVLDALGITGFTWRRYGRYEAGATGLALSAGEVLRIGELLLDGGRYRGRQVVPQAWVEAMRAPAVPATSEYAPPLRATAYGLGLWICDGGLHYCDGADGQFLIVVPATRTVVVALAEAGDTLTVARCLREAVLPGAGPAARS